MIRARSSALVLAASCSLAAATDLEGPNVKRLGNTVVRWKDDAVQVVVGHKHAGLHLDRKWILLEVGVTATSNRPIEVFREDVALLLPDGQRLQMPSQRRMAEGLKDLRRVLNEAKVARDPIDYFPFANREERLGFFAVPGEQIVFEKVTVNALIVAYGYVFFESPRDRWEPGIYTFVIQNRDAHVRLPLPLGIEGALERTK